MGLKIFKKISKYEYPSVVAAYDKIRKCIESSTTMDQLEGCAQMILIFKQNYSLPLPYVFDLNDRKSHKELKIKLGTYGK